MTGEKSAAHNGQGQHYDGRDRMRVPQCGGGLLPSMRSRHYCEEGGLDIVYKV
jgi:hypothetical protein